MSVKIAYITTGEDNEILWVKGDFKETQAIRMTLKRKYKMKFLH